MLYNIAIFIFVLVCIMLMGIILLQSSKTGGMGSAMGGQAINTAFGGQGADKLLMKITSFLAVSFMVLAIVIGMMENPNSRIDYSNKSTLSRNTGANQSNNDVKSVQETQQIETKPLDILNNKKTDADK